MTIENPEDEGGEAPCFAHLFEDELGLTRSSAANLAALVALPGDGVQWALTEPSELNANLVHLDPASEVAEHVNDEVDVLLVVFSGGGTLRVDGRDVALEPFTVAHVEKGSRRAISAGDGGVSYLSVHRRRGPLQVKRRA
jgi:quercetin dioxygenase-like cupin family protein